MQVVPFKSNRDRVAMSTGKTRSGRLPQITASKGQLLYAVRRHDGKYWHFCYTSHDVAHSLLVKIFSADDQNWVKSTDQTVLSRIVTVEQLAAV